MSRNARGGARGRKPDSTAKRYAEAYRCGHCNSRTGKVKRDADGFQRLTVSHDDHCPVLNGTLTDIPDSYRAAAQAGGGIVVIRLGGTE